jgi:hypothetical protein
MKKSRHQMIRNMLLESEDGMTVKEITERFDDATTKTICKTLKLIYGIYIDRWTVVKRGSYAAVYMCVDIPENAPHPTERYIPETMWVKSTKRNSHDIHC